MFAETFGDMLSVLSNPQAKHAAMVHLPIAIGVLGFLGLLVLAALRGRSQTLLRCCVAVYGIATLTAWCAEEAGEEAMDQLDTMVMTEAALESLETHEEMGERVWMWFGVTTVVTVCCGLTSAASRWRMVSCLVALGVAAGAAGFVAVTAHHGGSLVYEHGVVTPTTLNNPVDHEGAAP